MYDNNGEQINMYYGYYDEDDKDFIPTYTSVYSKLEDLPNYVYSAFVAIEDETFFDNYGFSPKRLLGAIVAYKLNGDSTYGASTITQQLVKIATGDTSHSAERKARELGAAIYLTEKWEKKQILESYINVAYYGDNSYGIYEASMNFFGKEPKYLNIAESATLAAMLNKPEGNNPYKGDEALERLMQRKVLVLNKMLELNFITQEEYSNAINYKVTFIGEDFEYRNKAIDQYIPLAMKEAKKLVMEYYGLSSTDEAFDMILDGNTKIYTNLDQELQQKSYDILKSTYADDIEMGYILTTKDGRVPVAVTSKNDSNIDHVYTMTRQTGSAIKPIGVYGPAFDLNVSSPDTVEIDEAVYIGNWQVHNYGNTYHGAMTVRDAIAYSYNTIAVKTLQKVGIYTSMDYLQRLGITSLTENDAYYPALALGGLSNGISPFEMCQAYNAINNDGVFSRISFISKIEINGITITPPANTERVFSSQANDLLKDCLRSVVEYGTATRAALDYHTVYAKTGTTSDSADFWTCGFTDDVTATIWTGYDRPREIEIIPSGHLSEIWKELVEAYYY
ncbi:MAG: transglycosylase domain-containing protein [Clostridia bacterium]|nr:transglycosylase domain-containing protein [Clostridia bacterium]